MCLSIPAKIISTDGATAEVEDYLNKKKKVLIAAIPEAKKNNWILISANLAIQKIPAKEAKELIKILKQK